MDNDFAVVALDEGSFEDITVVDRDGFLAVRESGRYVFGVADRHLALGHFVLLHLRLGDGGAEGQGEEGEEEESAEELHIDGAALVGLRPEEGLLEMIEGWRKLV